MSVTTLSAAGVLLAVHPALAQDSGQTHAPAACLQEVYMSPDTVVKGSNKLNCTADDIKISEVTDVEPKSCIEGTTIPVLEATFKTIVTANERYDATFFFNIDGGASARGDGATDQCSASALFTTAPAEELDGDTCGDLNSGEHLLTFTLQDVLCRGNSEGNLLLPNCTAWHSNEATTCDIDDPLTFDPETKSKCVCDDNFFLPVRVVNLGVKKTASPTQIPEPGGTVTFTVEITNESEDAVTIRSIIDDPYGNLGNGTAAVDNNTCVDLLGDTIEAGETKTCSFDAEVTGNAGDTPTDEVTACVTPEGVLSPQVCASDEETVTITNVLVPPTLMKSAKKTENCKIEVDATYEVMVTNNSADEKVTVTELMDDKFGDITDDHPAEGGFGQVVSTTCTVPTIIDEGGVMVCEFVGRIVETTCDFTHTDTVTAKVEDGEGGESFPSDSADVVVVTTP